VLWPCALWAAASPTPSVPTAPLDRIDRHALVTRHNIALTTADPLATLQVGNGEFAFAVDVTGLQTFPDNCLEGIQLGTQTQWAWGSAANPERFTLDDVLSPYDAHGRQVVYADGLGKLNNARNPDRANQANAWLRENPYRLQLGRFGLRLQHANGANVLLAELRAIRQTLDLWAGAIDSCFDYDGQPVHVQTVAHPRLDLIAVRLESPLVKIGRAGLEFERPLSASNIFTKLKCSSNATIFSINQTAGNASQFHSEAQQTITNQHQPSWGRASSQTPSDPGEAAGSSERTGNTRQHVTATNSTRIEAVLAFSPQPMDEDKLPSFESTREAAAAHWQAFWQSGGAVDLSGSKDPRWRELERRIVLSQYLTAIQCAGSMPPQETGLAQNSWFGKFHLEMHWWHAAHFALWGRPELLERSLGWYAKILPAARTLARHNGYTGARWPKMVGPEGADSPSPVGGFLIWQQPHPIYLVELLWRAHPDKATLDKYRELVAATAEFMASYAVWNEANQCYDLGPPLIPAQESYGPQRARVFNPTFELAYWHWGLQTAQAWRERLGLARDPRWDNVCQRLAKPHITQGRYDAIAIEPYTVMRDHPSMLQAFGFLPLTPLVETALMRGTLDFVLQEWDWKTTWGWDYPVLAMTAARLGRGEDAVNSLLLVTPKNRFLPNGHNYQRPNLPLYLPGNGGLLAAIALMAAGWDGSPLTNAPGFPDNGQWSVRWEGLKRMP
jgi:hypothetical protein